MRTVGVEEELLVVDETGRPVPLGPEALEVAARRGQGETVEQHDEAERAEQHGAEPPDEPGDGAHLVPELKAQQVELGTEVCRSLDEVAARLRAWRARADAAARAAGARVAALATSPLPVHPEPTDGERYERIHATFGPVADEQLTCGCHVHVSVEDDDEGVAVLNRIRGWLPVLTALTANSPFWQGEDTATPATATSRGAAGRLPARTRCSPTPPSTTACWRTCWRPAPCSTPGWSTSTPGCR